MANKENYIVSVILFLGALSSMISQGCVEGGGVRKYLGPKHKGSVKTIKSKDDVIDCVDIYKQPAFDHPLIKDIVMEPSWYPARIKLDESLPKLVQGWHKNGECPEGTIPIRRNSSHILHRKFPSSFHGRELDETPLPPRNGHEYAQVSEIGDTYYGVQAGIEAWNPKVENVTGELSTSQIWILSDFSDDTPNLNTIEAGWMVNPTLYGDSKTRLFIFWTSDGYGSTGCFDLSCSGFVQISREFAIGNTISPVSTYNQQSMELVIIIHKDKISGNWWLQLQGETIGYWPGSIFNRFDEGAKAVSWGGEIVNMRQSGHHTSTQMGSGHFSNEGFRRSSHFDRLGVLDSNGIPREPTHLLPYTSNPTCYDLSIKDNAYFFYGGPGYSPQCQ